MRQNNSMKPIMTQRRENKDKNKYLRMSDDDFNIPKPANTKELMTETEFQEFCRKRRESCTNV